MDHGRIVGLGWDDHTSFFSKNGFYHGKIAIEPSFVFVFYFFFQASYANQSTKHVDSFITPKTKMAGWKIRHEWRCISYWTWGIFRPAKFCLRECSWVKVRIPWCSHKRSFWIEDLGSTATGKMSCWFWCSRFASFSATSWILVSWYPSDFFLLKVSDWSLKKYSNQCHIFFSKQPQGLQHTARWNTHWGLKVGVTGSTIRTGRKLTWENRAPKDWQVASLLVM